jgi:lipoate---protein ligase
MQQSSDDTSLSPAEHVARDWRIFQAVESGAAAVRWSIWDTHQPVVVLGRANRVDDWVDVNACRRDGVEVLRRCSGGGAVVLGPGCLNYAIGLSIVSRPRLADVAASFRIVLECLIAELQVEGLMVAGLADLAIEGRKVSGNAQRRGRYGLLHHGTVLYDFDAKLADRYLREPPRQPAYRAGRSHRRFMGNLPLSAGAVRRRMEAACRALIHSSHKVGVMREHMHNDAHVPRAARPSCP